MVKIFRKNYFILLVSLLIITNFKVECNNGSDNTNNDSSNF